MAADTNFAFKIAAKPLQRETWLLLTAYRNSLSPYPTVSPIPSTYGAWSVKWREERRHVTTRRTQKVTQLSVKTTACALCTLWSICTIRDLLTRYSYML